MSNFKKLIGLLKRTGDKAIVVDEMGNPNFVIMDLEGYEKLILDKSSVKDLTEDEFLDRINRDIEIWKDGQREESIIDNLANSIQKRAPLRSTFGPEYFMAGHGYSKNEVESEKEEENDDDHYYF
ncbi:MAG: hypothetical protein WCL61_02745 [bacterium]